MRLPGKALWRVASLLWLTPAIGFALTAVPGYPTQLGAGVVTAPRFIDLNGDLTDELVVVTGDGLIHALLPDGTELQGFPFAVGTTVNAQPAFAQLDSGGNREVVVSTLEGALGVYRTDGTRIVDVSIGAELRAAPVVAQGTAGPLLVVVSQPGALHVFDRTGQPWPGSPLTLPLSDVRNAPAAADLDGDSLPELVIAGNASDGRALAVLVHVTRTALTLQSGWPVELSATTEALPPLIADFDGDDVPEIAVGAVGVAPRVLDSFGQIAVETEWPLGTTGSANVLPAVAKFGALKRLTLIGALGDKLAAWSVGTQLIENRSGPDVPAQLRTGFPTVAPVQGGIAVADVDGDSTPDLVGWSNGELVAFDGAAQPVSGFSEPVSDAFVDGPSIGIFSDRLAIAATTQDGSLFAWYGIGQPSDIQWDGPGHDPEHTSFYGTPLPERVLGGGIGIDEPPKLPPPGCCTGAPGGLDVTGIGLLLWLVRRRVR